MRIGVAPFFINAAVTIGISVLTFRVIREYSVGRGVVLVAASVVWFAMQGMDNSHILSMLSLSEQFHAANGATPELFATLGTAARSTRRWVHYTELLVVDA